MATLLIRNISDKTIAALDATAQAQGLSREEYVRRRLDLWAKQHATADEVTTTLAVLDDLDQLAREIDALNLPPTDSSMLMRNERREL